MGNNNSAIRRKAPRYNARLGGWLPHDHKKIHAYLNELRKQVQVKAAAGEDLLPVVQVYKDFIENDAAIYAACNMMIAQANDLHGNVTNPGLVHLKDYKEMCSLINVAIQYTPPYNDTELVAFPINAILDLTMVTPAGYAFYASERVNKYLGDIVKYWGDYLSSTYSLVAFSKEAWMSPSAQAKLNMDWYEQPDPDALAWGYQSWNDWFIRPFKPGMRPIDSPNDETVIISGCESTPFDLEADVQLRSDFWLKGQPYSLSFMLNSEEKANDFVGGVVYQAFLSAFEYHRWHSPIEGTVIDFYNIPGTYYASSPSVTMDTAGPDLSQGYITNVAARAVFIIEAANKSIGKMCMVAVGMSEVSSCVIHEKFANGDTYVQKGEELGYFLFGGSTHCLVFQEDVIQSWSDNVKDPNNNELKDEVIHLGKQIATVKPSN